MKALILVIITFFVAQLINVFLNTTKTLVMAKFNSMHLSAVVNAVAFGFYTCIVRMIADLPLEITITVTFITNLIGVYLSYFLIQKLRKDELQKIEIYLKDYMELLIAEIDKENLQYNRITHNLIVVYAYTKEESKKTRKILEHFGKAKINITEVKQEI